MSLQLIYKSKTVLKINRMSEVWPNEVNSDIISVGSDEWQICVGPEKAKDKEFVSIYLYLMKSNDSSVELRINACLLDTESQELYARRNCGKCQLKETEGLGWDQFIRHSVLITEKDDYLPNDTLVVSLDIFVYKTLNTGVNRNLSLENSFNNKDLNDCRLVVQKKEFFASKAILSSQSDVFRQMFMNDMTEKNTNEVIIDDIDSEVFREFLRFIYFGTSDKLEEMVVQLIHVSDKYNVLDLKTICENLMFLRINTTNVFTILEVMDKYNNEELKTKTIGFIRDNWSESLEQKWCEFVGNSQSLMKSLVMGLMSDRLEPKKSRQAIEMMSFTYSYFEKSRISEFSQH